LDPLLAKDAKSFTLKAEGETGWFGIGLIDKDLVDENFDIKKVENKRNVWYALSMDGNPWEI
jgi:hypothetical protein